MRLQRRLQVVNGRGWRRGEDAAGGVGLALEQRLDLGLELLVLAPQLLQRRVHRRLVLRRPLGAPLVGD